MLNIIKKAIVKRSVINRTRKELQSLSDRDLRDIGISRCDIEQIARSSVK